MPSLLRTMTVRGRERAVDQTSNFRPRHQCQSLNPVRRVVRCSQPSRRCRFRACDMSAPPLGICMCLQHLASSTVVIVAGVYGDRYVHRRRLIPSTIDSTLTATRIRRHFHKWSRRTIQMRSGGGKMPRCLARENASWDGRHHLFRALVTSRFASHLRAPASPIVIVCDHLMVK